MTRVGIVGCGTIGSELARALERDYRHVARVVALVDPQRPHALRLQQQLSSRPPIVSLPELIRRSQLVLETATAAVAARVVRLALTAHRDVLVMSTGGLLAAPASWQRAARRSRGRLYIPSGALAGIDGIKAMAVGTIRAIRLTTRKPPRALADAPLVRARGLKLAGLRTPKVLFDGSPRDAIRAFPQNANIAATMFLACGAKSQAARVRVVADPALTRNIHELDIEGDCGRIRVQIESRPSSNPKTSELAVRSALAALRQLFEPVRIGT